VTLRARLVVAAGACLLVVIAAFFGVQQRQEQVLLDQLDTQLTLVADQGSSVSVSGLTTPEPGPVTDTGELYAGAVDRRCPDQRRHPSLEPRSRARLDDIRRAPRDEPVTIGTSDNGIDMRVIVQDVDGLTLVIGQSTEPIDDAIRSLQVSGLVPSPRSAPSPSSSARG
jgi:hypothetical protein